jgi:hypothetical protein
MKKPVRSDSNTMNMKYVEAPLPGAGYGDICAALGVPTETPVGRIVAMIGDLQERATLLQSFEQPKTVKFSVIENPRKKGKTHADYASDNRVADLNQ